MLSRAHSRTNLPANNLLGAFKLLWISNVLSVSRGRSIILLAFIAYLPIVTPLEETMILTLVVSLNIKLNSSGSRSVQLISLVFSMSVGSVTQLLSPPHDKLNTTLFLEKVCTLGIWNVWIAFIIIFTGKYKGSGGSACGASCITVPPTSRIFCTFLIVLRNVPDWSAILL